MRATLETEVAAWVDRRNGAGRDHRLAVYDGGCPHQAQAPLPISRPVTGY